MDYKQEHPCPPSTSPEDGRNKDAVLFIIFLCLETETEQGQRDTSLSLLCLGGLVLMVLSINEVLGI